MTIMPSKAEYHYQADELRDKLLSKLKEKVFHVTSYDRYKIIEESGMIKSNADGKLGFTYPQSENSYGRKRGYICLFDLRDKTAEEIENALECFYFLGDHTLGDKQVYLILKDETYSELIDTTQAKAEIDFKEMWIPYVECWYPENLLLSNIQEIIIVNIEREPLSDLTKAIIQASAKFFTDKSN